LWHITLGYLSVYLSIFICMHFDVFLLVIGYAIANYKSRVRVDGSYEVVEVEPPLFWQRPFLLLYFLASRGGDLAFLLPMLCYRHRGTVLATSNTTKNPTILTPKY